MKNYFFILLALPVTFSMTECNKSVGASILPTPDPCIYLGSDTCKAKSKILMTVNLNETKQTIHSFGASDCWTTKFIGKWNNTQKKDQVADYLFSQDTLSDGSPKGIALSLWRFNIGGGSYEQGTMSNISDEWRREECFLNADGSYNWNKEEGQQWFLQAAKQRGVKYSLGFAITPPVYMTKNGKAYNGTGGTAMNIQDGKMDVYADFLSQVTKHFGFDYVSPVNEPQWAWGTSTGASQEGTQATNSEIATLVKQLSPKLSGTNSKVVIGEAGQLDFLYSRNTDGRGDQINQFFSPSSVNYIGNLPNVEHAISAHSYFTTCPDNNMINVRNQVANKIGQVDASLQTWQSEFGILGNICDLYNGSPRNRTIDYGLYVAKVIHHDLTIADVTSWQWWLAVSPYNYSDALVYINDPSGNINVNNCKDDGIVLDSKQLWAFGNYSRFIRPGMQRITASLEGINDPVMAAGSLMVSAFKDVNTKKLVIVIINMGTESKNLQLSSSVKTKNNMLNTYLTDANDNLKKSTTTTDNILINAKSVVTLTGEYQ
jgi:hypothetical protein